MSATLKCSICLALVESAGTDEPATCSRCRQLLTAHPEAASSVNDGAVQGGKNVSAAAELGIPVAAPGRPNQDGAMPAWMSPWALASFCFAGLAVALGSQVGERPLTLSLSAMGLAVFAVGAWTSRGRGEVSGLVSLSIGGLLCLGALLVTLVAPEVVNPLWRANSPPPVYDANLLLVVPRDGGYDAGTPLPQDEWVDATAKAIRQDDLLVRIAYVRSGPLPDRGPNPVLIVNMQMSLLRPGRTNKYERFTPGKREPKLTDDAGRSYTFFGDRKRKAPSRLDPGFLVDQLLIFQLPPTEAAFLNLELPASAWGREGTCRFRITTVGREPTGETAKQIAQTLAMLKRSPAVPPDPPLGRTLFVKTCMECHTLYGVVAKIGPDLTKSKRGDLTFLLTSILDPSAVIEKDYKPTIVTTTTGLIYNGIIKHADADKITLYVPSRMVVVPRSQIEEMHESKVSIMPTGLLKEFKEHEVRSLIAYLSGTQQTPMLATVDIAPVYFFLGRDISLWHDDGPPWKVVKGEIAAPAQAGKAAQLISDLHIVDDFHLTVRFHPGKEGRAAVLIRDATRGRLATAPRVEFKAGEPLALEGVSGPVARGKEEPMPRAEEWNTLEIIVAGKQLRVRLNNEDAFSAANPDLPARRAIALQGPDVAGQDVRFRNLALRLLAREK